MDEKIKNNKTDYFRFMIKDYFITIGNQRVTVHLDKTSSCNLILEAALAIYSLPEPDHCTPITIRGKNTSLVITKILNLPIRNKTVSFLVVTEKCWSERTAGIVFDESQCDSLVRKKAP